MIRQEISYLSTWYKDKTAFRQPVVSFQNRSKFFTVHGDREKRKESLAKDERVRSKLCTGKKMAVIFGLELCTESQTPISSLQVSMSPFLAPQLKIGRVN